MTPNLLNTLKLNRSDLMTLEAYAVERNQFRSRAIAHKRQRSVSLGAHMTLLFEDRITVQYQIQEMLRAERIFDPQGIQEELDAYNPLISDPDNLKATLLIEYPDPAIRVMKLAELREIENRLYMQVGDGEKKFAIADEDMNRSNSEKTSAVHFVRFPINAKAQESLRAGAPLAFGIDDIRYPQHQELNREQQNALLSDLL